MNPLQPGDEVTIRGKVVAIQQTVLGRKLVTVHIEGPQGSVTGVMLWESQVESVLTEPVGPKPEEGGS